MRIKARLFPHRRAVRKQDLYDHKTNKRSKNQEYHNCNSFIFFYTFNGRLVTNVVTLF
jgi:hypothetical protein